MHVACGLADAPVCSSSSCDLGTALRFLPAQPSHASVWVDCDVRFRTAIGNPAACDQAHHQRTRRYCTVRPTSHVLCRACACAHWLHSCQRPTPSQTIAAWALKLACNNVGSQSFKRGVASLSLFPIQGAGEKKVQCTLRLYFARFALACRVFFVHSPLASCITHPHPHTLRAQSGTGKTATFSIAALQSIDTTLRYELTLASNAHAKPHGVLVGTVDGRV